MANARIKKVAVWKIFSFENHCDQTFCISHELPSMFTEQCIVKRTEALEPQAATLVHVQPIPTKISQWIPLDLLRLCTHNRKIHNNKNLSKKYIFLQSVWYTSRIHIFDQFLREENHYREVRQRNLIKQFQHNCFAIQTVHINLEDITTLNYGRELLIRIQCV